MHMNGNVKKGNTVFMFLTKESMLLIFIFVMHDFLVSNLCSRPSCREHALYHNLTTSEVVN